MNRPGFLGQVAIQPGTGFGNAPIYWPGGYGPRVPAPPNAPTTTMEQDMWGLKAGKKCYRTRSGDHRLLSVTQVESMRAAGMPVEPADERNCPGLAGKHLGQGVPTNVSVAPTVHDGGGFMQPNQLEFTFWHDRLPNWPYRYPQHLYPNYPAQARPNERLICRRLEEQSEAEGRDVLECHYEQVARPVNYTYPVVQLFPIY